MSGVQEIELSFNVIQRTLLKLWWPAVANSRIGNCESPAQRERKSKEDGIAMHCLARRMITVVIFRSHWGRRARLISSLRLLTFSST